MKKTLFILCLITLFACKKEATESNYPYLEFSKNILHYRITPENKFDKNGLMFSDQGAWFAYGFPGSNIRSSFPMNVGFTGPFLMTQQNGVWSSKALLELSLENVKFDSQRIDSYASHLEQIFRSTELALTQKLVFLSGHTAIIQSSIKNISDKKLTVNYQWKINEILADSLNIQKNKEEIIITSTKSDAVGHLLMNPSSSSIELKPNESEVFTISQTFIFPEYDWVKEKERIQQTDFED